MSEEETQTLLPKAEENPLIIKDESSSINGNSVEIKDEEIQGTAHWLSVYFNLINSTVGAGIVAIPLVLNQCGIIVGIIMMVLNALLANYSLHLLILSSHIKKKYSYKDLAIEAFGKWVGPIFEICIIMLCYGVCTVFVIIMSRMFPSLIQLITDIPILSNMYLVTSIIMIPLFILCSLKRIEFLAYTSFIAIVGILYMVLVVIAKFFERTAKSSLPNEDFVWVNSDIIQILNSIPTLVFAYGSHITLLPMYSELKNRNPRYMSYIINSGVFTCLFFYMLVGSAGYLQFANIIPFSDAILDLYPSNDWFINVAKLLIGIVVVLSYPLVHFACRASIENVIFPGKPYNLIRSLIITLFIVSTTYLLGVFVRQIVIVFGLIMVRLNY